jgi:lysophospholipase L1-like esterase
MLKRSILFVALTLSVLAGSVLAAEPVRVACIGDSITAGAGIRNRKMHYPTQLGVILGDGYKVINCGNSGSTMLKNGDKPFWKQRQWKAAMDFNPNIVVIKLGTNDSKPRNWKKKGEFAADYKDMIAQLRKLPAKPKIFICKPVPAFPGRWGITDKVIKEEVIPITLQVALDTKCPVIDLYKALSGKKEMFPDTVHPNAAGAGVMAQVIAKAITGKPAADSCCGKCGSFFNGKDLKDWTAKPSRKTPSLWSVGTPKVDPKNPKQLIVVPGGNAMVNTPAGHGKSLDFYSGKKHGDGIITLDLMVPKGSNSGIYLQGEYEIQVLDSYGRKKMGMGDMGAVYGATPPKANACKKPGEWQKYEIHYQAPKFDAKGKKIANARIIKVLLNGTLIQENIELQRPTPGGVDGKEKAMGPLMFQGNHGPVAYRNIMIKPLK